MITLANFITNADDFHRKTHLDSEPNEFTEMNKRLKPIMDSFIKCYNECGPMCPKISMSEEIALSMAAVAAIEMYLNRIKQQ